MAMASSGGAPKRVMPVSTLTCTSSDASDCLRRGSQMLRRSANR